MVNEKINLGIKGHIEIYANDKLVFDDHNDIEPTALDVILLSLTHIPDNSGIDFIKASGLFPAVKKEITNAELDIANHTVKFTTIFEETDFDGYIQQLHLLSKTADNPLASRKNLSILKDSNTRIKIIWKITINII